MTLPPEALAGATIALLIVGALAMVGAKAAVAGIVGKWFTKPREPSLLPGPAAASPPMRDHVLSIPEQPHRRALDAASVRERCDAAAKTGADACVALVRELAEEGAREECASCTSLRVDLKAERAGRLADLHAYYPAVQAMTEAVAQNTAATAKLVDFLREKL